MKLNNTFLCTMLACLQIWEQPFRKVSSLFIIVIIVDLAALTSVFSVYAMRSETAVQ